MFCVVFTYWEMLRFAALQSGRERGNERRLAKAQIYDETTITRNMFVTAGSGIIRVDAMCNYLTQFPLDAKTGISHVVVRVGASIILRPQ